MLPPGVSLDDPRLLEGRVIEETTSSLEPGDLGEWPPDAPFEVDVDQSLVPPVWGERGKNVHYTVYPSDRFAKSRCELCSLQKAVEHQGALR